MIWDESDLRGGEGRASHAGKLDRCMGYSSHTAKTGHLRIMSCKGIHAIGSKDRNRQPQHVS